MDISFALSFKASEPLHVAFLKWKDTATDEQLMNAFLCGYCIVSSDVLAPITQPNQDAINQDYRERIKAFKEKYDQDHQDHIQRLKLQYNKDQDDANIRTKQIHDFYRDKIQSDCNQWIVKYEMISKEYTEYVKGALESTRENTKDNEIKELRAQLNVLQNSNIYKGDIGELQIRDVLSRNFIGYEIRDTSGEANMSDIHLIDRDGYILAIESKNKSIVTAVDINKSINDIKVIKNKYGDRFIGYLFISIRSNNIPKKGDLYFEMIEDIPIIWYGTDKITPIFEHDINNLIKLLFMHRSYQMNIDNTTSHINEYMRRISEMKKQIDQMSTSVTHIKNNLQLLQNNIEWVYGDMFQLIGSPTGQQHICQHCQAAYKRKGDLDRHLKSKHNI